MSCPPQKMTNKVLGRLFLTNKNEESTSRLEEVQHQSDKHFDFHRSKLPEIHLSLKSKNLETKKISGAPQLFLRRSPNRLRGYWPFAKYHVSGPQAMEFLDRMVPNRRQVGAWGRPWGRLGFGGLES